MFVRSDDTPERRQERKEREHKQLGTATGYPLGRGEYFDSDSPIARFRSQLEELGERRIELIYDWQSRLNGPVRPGAINVQQLIESANEYISTIPKSEE